MHTSRRLLSVLPHRETLKLTLNTFEYSNQTAYVGKDALRALGEFLAGKNLKKPLIVTDKGVVNAGIVNQVIDELKAVGVEPVVFDGCKPNPSFDDVSRIAKSFITNNRDSCIGLGGGGPMDAAKAGAALVAEHRVHGSDVSEAAPRFITETCRKFSAHVTPEFQNAVPVITAIPTTAGTGSDGGKSAVITDSKGQKVVFGNPVLMPTIAALAPQLTIKLPKRLTIDTAVDALFHCIEPLFCPTELMVSRDRMSLQEIAFCDNHAKEGIALIREHLPLVVEDPEQIFSRMYLQVAALYGAKAFRKGDLGGVHATAHSVGVKYHLHHGAAIGRMAVPVLEFNETHPDLSTEAVQTAATVCKLLGGSDTMHQAVYSFLKKLDVTMGLRNLVEWNEDLDELARLAATDACQDNPVPLGEADYRKIFEKAAAMQA
eukprot:c12671_g1_i1.p1 GENE.c12671_g1_i1~~c12671_g1_i1.p1  ORF type:complete len:431 (-),score=89.91 c12671_g1_i1:21-1313(-)